MLPKAPSAKTRGLTSATTTPTGICFVVTGDSVFLSRGLRPARPSPEVPCRGQLHSHQLVPRVARGRLGVCERSLLAGDRGHPGEAGRTQILASVPDTGPSGPFSAGMAPGAGQGCSIGKYLSKSTKMETEGSGPSEGQKLQGFVLRDDDRCQGATKPREGSSIGDASTVLADVAGVGKHVLL